MSRERLGVAGVWVLIGAPMMAHGLWRPLEQALGSGGDAGWVTWAALVVAAVAWVALGVGRLHAAGRFDGNASGRLCQDAFGRYSDRRRQPRDLQQAEGLLHLGHQRAPDAALL